MEAVKMIKERRSVRKFKDEKVDREIMKDVIKTATYSPTWANFQIVRYTVIDDKELMERLADESMADFPANVKVTKRAAGVVVLSYVKGLSGTYPNKGYVTSKGDAWEMFDAGIACQTFCLAAYEKGIGTVIMGIFDEDKVVKVIELPEDEAVAAIIPYGYEIEHPQERSRKGVDEVLRFK